MKLLRQTGLLCDALDQPVPTSNAWDWAVWGRVDEVADLEATLRTAGDCVVVITADDTESRLLAGGDTRWLVPFAALPWTLGCAVPRSSTATTWGRILTEVSGVVWDAVSERPATVSRPALAPQPWKPAVAGRRALIQPFQTSTAADATALEAGWLQLADDLDGSHQCSQSIEGQGRQQSGDYWHAIMHRREPDYGNAQYWFRQFGRHDVFAVLAEEVPRVAAVHPSSKFQTWQPRLNANGRWNPLAFVTCCQEAASTGDAAFRVAVEELQYREMCLLLRQTWRDATGQH
ncbi:MAG TPA: hypothetical protein VM165_11000 [Planctomycetaceae bacterium]|nr:hypothetical protein [Planctomycetaceae bacterium]